MLERSIIGLLERSIIEVSLGLAKRMREVKKFEDARGMRAGCIPTRGLCQLCSEEQMYKYARHACGSIHSR
jgi:hypothetical protein